MALLRKINTKAKTEINTGFGANAADYGGRFVNKNGQPNIEKQGVNFFERISWFHSMLAIPRWKFFFLIFAFYILVNVVFACILLLKKLLWVQNSSRCITAMMKPIKLF